MMVSPSSDRMDICFANILYVHVDEVRSGGEWEEQPQYRKRR